MRNKLKDKKLYELTDGSWSLSITKDGLNSTCPAWKAHGKREWEILAENCDLPAESEEYKRNDTIIRDIANGEVVFTRKRFLRELKRFSPLYKYCPYCGSKINMYCGCSY